MDINDLQKKVEEWSFRNFGAHYGSGYRNLLGVVEEVGELTAVDKEIPHGALMYFIGKLCHAQLKGEQLIRHTPDQILSMKKDAIGDIVVFLCNYASSQFIDINECLELAWNEIKDRDWTKNKVSNEQH